MKKSIIFLCILLGSLHGKVFCQTSFKSLNYIYSISGKKVLSGQHNDQKDGTGAATYTDKVYSITGKYPALYSADFLFHGSSSLRWDITYEAERQWNAGAVVNFMWHACPPTQDASCQWDGGIKSYLSDAQWNDLITDGGNLNGIWKQRIDEISVYLQYLEDKGVEVLWRPLHEMNQGAFWWGGRTGPNGTRKLYQLTRDYMQNVKGLNNLIWIWDVQDFSTNYSDYNPGNNYWDIAALDVYGDGYSNPVYYNALVAQAGNKPVAIGECAKLPGSSTLSGEPRFTFFMNWSYFLQQENTDQFIRDVYNDSRVITRDEMPGWKTVPQNLATNKTVVVSSTETGANVAGNAVDGQYGTRWSSVYSDPQWLYVDLGGRYNVNRIKITWEAAYGKDYLLQVSDDAVTWSNVKTVTGNSTFENDHTGLNGAGRYVRIYGTARGTVYGYSIYELEVYGNAIIVQSPYKGSPISIPGTIQAEEFDLGGEGVAYHDLSTGNQFGVFRSDNVDVENCTDAGGGYNIAGVQAGEWTEYMVSVSAAGTYDLSVRVATTMSARTFHIELDGANISGTINVPNTGGWQNWQTVKVPNISLAAGQKVLRIVMDSDLFNINYITFNTNSGNKLPLVNITSPLSNTSFIAPATINIIANASDPDGTISKVEFYNGSVKLGEDNSSPFSYAWNNVNAGSYSISAKAMDNLGAVVSSSLVTITVSQNINNCSGIVEYKENGGYVAGSKVQSGGNIYECKPWPYSGWCNAAAWAYAPGSGAYWSDAWMLKGSCTVQSSSMRSLDLEAIQLYPNPATENVTVKLNSNQEFEGEIVIVSSIGNEVFKGRIKSGEELQINLSKLESGLYFVKVISSSENWSTIMQRQ